MVTEHQVAVSRHQRETVLAETRKMAERQQQEYGLMARRRRLTVTAIDLPGPTSDLRHNQLLQQILKYEAVFDSLKLATHSHDKQVTLIVVCLSLCLSCPVLSVCLSVCLSFPFLSCPVLSCLSVCLSVLSFPFLSCLVLSVCPFLSFPFLSCPVCLSFPFLSYPVLSCLSVCLSVCPFLSFPFLSCPVCLSVCRKSTCCNIFSDKRLS